MEFEELQKSWKARTVHTAANLDQLKAGFQSKWQKNQKALFRSNMFMSIGFATAMIVIGWVYFSFHKEFGWAFRASIAACYLLMIVFFFASWRSYSFQKEDLQSAATEHIEYQLNKLQWQRRLLTVYVWIYNLLLWAALMMYILHLTGSNRATLLFRLVAMSICTIYIASISIATRRNRAKKVKAIDAMVAELQQMKHAMPDVD